MCNIREIFIFRYSWLRNNPFVPCDGQLGSAWSFDFIPSLYYPSVNPHVYVLYLCNIIFFVKNTRNIRSRMRCGCSILARDVILDFQMAFFDYLFNVWKRYLILIPRTSWFLVRIHCCLQCLECVRRKKLYNVIKSKWLWFMGLFTDADIVSTKRKRNRF